MTGGPEDLVTQFPTCACGRRTCLTCRRGWQLTPRMVASLRWAAALTADEAYDDVETHGNEPVPPKAWDWALFDLYPRSTWNAGAQWRRQAARAYDDLAGDIDAGIWPLPRCPAEELALQTLLVRLRDWFADRDDWQSMLWDELEALPQHHDDEDVDDAWKHLTRSDEELSAYPDEDRHPRAHEEWFELFDGAEKRDLARGFRR